MGWPIAFVVGLAIFAGLKPARAGMSPYEISGETVTPQKRDDIRLVSECVDMSLLPGMIGGHDMAQYECRFELKNLSDEGTEVLLGVKPDGLIHFEGDRSWPDWVFRYRFIVSGDDATCPVFCRPTADRKGPEVVFLWNASFGPKESRSFRVHYTTYVFTPLSSTNQFDLEMAKYQHEDVRYHRKWHAMLERCHRAKLEYTSDPASCWNGPAESMTIRLCSPDPTKVMRWRNDMVLTTVFPGQHVLMSVGEGRIEFSPGYWISEPKAGRHVFSARRVGSISAQVAWLGTVLPADPEKCSEIVQQLMGEDPTAAEVLELRDITAAFHGVRCSNPDLNAFLKRQTWFDAEASVPVSELSENQREVLLRLESIADQIKSKQQDETKTVAPE